MYSVRHVGGGLPPIAVGQPAYLSLTHRHRGQAPSHSLIGRVSARYRSGSKPADQRRQDTALSNTHNPVGGGLPPIAVEQPAFLSLTHRHRGQAPSHSLIGRVSARYRSGSKPADQRRQDTALSNTHNPVGGGLPPIAVEQPAYLSLPHRHRGQAPSHSLIAG